MCIRLLLFTSLLAAFCLSFAAADPVIDPIKWLSPATHDFGDIVRDVPVVHEFKYQNNTDAPLIIDNVRTSCGCTTSEWQTQPVAPDSIGVLRVEYDAYSKGYFRKYVKVYFNGQRKAVKLWLEGYVE